MTREQLTKNIAALPPAARRQVEELVEILGSQQQPAKKMAIKTTDFEKSGFIGMWKNRNDLKSSTNWVRKLRQSEW